MWFFPRRAKAPQVTEPKALPAEGEIAPTVESGPQLVRRVEITVEREWTSTVVRRRPSGSREVPDASGEKDRDG